MEIQECFCTRTFFFYWIYSLVDFFFLLLPLLFFLWLALSLYDANHTTDGNVLRDGGRLSGVRARRITLSCLTKCHCLVTGRGMDLLAVADKSCHQWAILPAAQRVRGERGRGREVLWLLSMNDTVHNVISTDHLDWRPTLSTNCCGAGEKKEPDLWQLTQWICRDCFSL